MSFTESLRLCTDSQNCVIKTVKSSALGRKMERVNNAEKSDIDKNPEMNELEKKNKKSEGGTKT